MKLKTNKDKAEIENVLIGVTDVLNEISITNVNFWALQYVWTASSYVFDLQFEDFEKKTREKPKGLIVKHEDFLKFAIPSTEVYEGTFIALSNSDSEEAIFILENFDSGEWIIETNDQSIIQRLISMGWSESEYAPQVSYYKVL